MKGIISWSVFTRWFLTELCLCMCSIARGLENLNFFHWKSGLIIFFPDLSSARLDFESEIGSLLSLFEYYQERIRAADIYEKQLQLALEIGSLFAKKKLQYFKARTLILSPASESTGEVENVIKGKNSHPPTNCFNDLWHFISFSFWNDLVVEVVVFVAVNEFYFTIYLFLQPL